MLRLMHRLTIVIAFASLLLAALLISGAALAGAAHAAAQNNSPAPYEPPPGGSPAPARYRAILPAVDRTARTALTEAGVALDAIGEDSVVTVVDAEGLSRLHAQGLIPVSVAPLDFPPADSAYHNYAEMMSAIQQIAATHPHITRVFTAGLSLEGRPILAVKISDVPDVDDPTEPAVLFFALTHAREHLTVEMGLAVIRLFTEGYGQDPALTNLVNTREIWVLPNINPDGGEYDIESGFYRWWRKNRRPNPDGSYGVDLNRNYGYRWGCCGGSSDIPDSLLYRGPAPFSEPETQVVRDFVQAHPDITAAITFHTYSELILYPYGYTDIDQPPDMAPDDHRAFVALARRMADTNGYTPQQASDLYTTDGDAVDWLYGARRIFAFTFEMYPAYDPPGFYPPAGVIETETRRNHAAVTYLTAVADNPRKVIGLGGDAITPAVSITVTAPAVSAGQALTATATVSDDVGVTLVAWQVDGQTVAIQTVEPYSLTATPAVGTHMVQALAFDAGGNRGASAPLTVVVDLPGPWRLFLPAIIGGLSTSMVAR
ncbi:MAG: Ig-like domain-containing protein [Anaerolineae bacterium]|nr:Ig-like domain-containing protein [Anaerolineae bacterium]